MCFGGDSGGRPLEREERELLRMQTATAAQGIRGREEAMGGYRGFVERGRTAGSLSNQDLEAGRYMEDALSNYGNMRRMRDSQMMRMGVNPGDPRFARGSDVDSVRGAAAAASGMNEARRGVRSEGLRLEGAGYAGLGGFDPTGALNAMGSTIGNAQRTAQQADAAEAQGWGQVGQAGMYALANADKIQQGWNTFFGSDGGQVPSYAQGGIVRHYAQGGNVYDRANAEVGQMRRNAPRSMPGQPQPGVDPVTATKLARTMVDKAAGSSLGYGAATPGVSMGSQQAAMLAQQTGAFGAEGLAATAAAAEGATVGAGAAGAAGAGAGAAGAGAAGAGAAGALSAIGTALPWVGGALMIGKALNLFADGGQVGIDRMASGGRAMNPKGGEVSGPGGPKDDMVPAYLSPGEFVMPVGAVQKFGLDRMEKMRQQGLEFERGYA